MTREAPLANRIRELRLLQLPLAEIEVLLTADDRDTVAGCLEQHRERIRQRIAEYRRIFRDLPTVEEWTKERAKEQSVSEKDTDKAYKCSFCNKPYDEVGRLIAGPNGVFICNECVGLCNEIIKREGLREEPATA